MSKQKANSLENITRSEMDTSQTQDSLKVMLHGTIRNDDFQRNPALQCWSTIVTTQNNVATMLQRCVALKIVVADHLVYHHIKLGNNINILCSLERNPCWLLCIHFGSLACEVTHRRRRYKYKFGSKLKKLVNWRSLCKLQLFSFYKKGNSSNIKNCKIAGWQNVNEPIHSL